MVRVCIWRAATFGGSGRLAGMHMCRCVFVYGVAGGAG